MTISTTTGTPTTASTLLAEVATGSGTNSVNVAVTPGALALELDISSISGNFRIDLYTYEGDTDNDFSSARLIWTVTHNTTTATPLFFNIAEVRSNIRAVVTYTNDVVYTLKYLQWQNLPVRGRNLPNNRSVTALAYNETYTGEWEYVEEYASIIVAAKADQDGTLYVDLSTDGATTQSTLSYDIEANSNDVHRLVITRPFLRLRYTNDNSGGQPQGSFDLYAKIDSSGIVSAPANQAMQQDADSITVRAIEQELDISNGLRSGYQIVQKYGRNPAVSTADVPEDLEPTGGVYAGFPTSGSEKVEIVSASANDTAAGSGARTVEIFGLSTGGSQISETITLNGTTPVDSTGTYTRVHRAVVKTSGSSNQAFNDGAITVRHTTTTSNVFLTIPAGTNQSQFLGYTIPLGYKGYLRHFDIGVSRTNTAVVEVALWVREFGESPRLIRQFSVSNDSRFTDDIYGGIELGPRCDFVFRATSSTANNVIVNGNFDMILIKQ